MATVTVYDKDRDATFNVTVTLMSSLTQTDAAPTQEGQGDPEYYLIINTSIPTIDGGSYPSFYIKTLDDAAPSQPSPASTWDDLIDGYIEYFLDTSIYASSNSSNTSDSTISSESSESTSTSNELETLVTLYDRVNEFDGTGVGGIQRGRGSECTWFGQFNGIDNYIEENSLVGTLDLTSNFTISIWVKTNADGHWFALNNTTLSNPYFVIGTAGAGTPFLTMTNDVASSKLIFPLGGSILDNLWHNITVIFDGTDYFLYVDGASTGSALGALAGPYTLDDMTIGASKPGTTTPSGFATGRSTGIRIYQRDLSAGEITTLNGAGECAEIDVVSPTSMLAFYDFDPDPNYSSSSGT